MQNKDAAHVTPGSGNMSALYTSSLNDTSRRVVAQTTQEHPANWLLETHEHIPLIRILVVEDDSSLAKLVANVLTDRGYVVTVVDDGEQAITAFHQSRPDLVVLDIELSGTLNGWDVLESLRTFTSVPVLLTSSETEVYKHIRTSGESQSTLSYLPKPYPIQTLLKCVERMLQGGPYGPQGRS